MLVTFNTQEKNLLNEHEQALLKLIDNADVIVGHPDGRIPFIIELPEEKKRYYFEHLRRILSLFDNQRKHAEKKIRQIKKSPDAEPNSHLVEQFKELVQATHRQADRIRKAYTKEQIAQFNPQVAFLERPLYWLNRNRWRASIYFLFIIIAMTIVLVRREDNRLVAEIMGAGFALLAADAIGAFIAAILALITANYLDNFFVRTLKAAIAHVSQFLSKHPILSAIFAAIGLMGLVMALGVMFFIGSVSWLSVFSAVFLSFGVMVMPMAFAGIFNPVNGLRYISLLLFLLAGFGALSFILVLLGGISFLPGLSGILLALGLAKASLVNLASGLAILITMALASVHALFKGTKSALRSGFGRSLLFGLTIGLGTSFLVVVAQSVQTLPVIGPLVSNWLAPIIGSKLATIHTGASIFIGSIATFIWAGGEAIRYSLGIGGLEMIDKDSLVLKSNYTSSSVLEGLGGGGRQVTPDKKKQPKVQNHSYQHPIFSEVKSEVEEQRQKSESDKPQKKN